MNNRILHWAQRILSQNGRYTTYHTPKEKIQTLIASLHPYTTNRDLIRYGGTSDGGYLIPDDLEGIEACFSPGVERMSEFEISCYKAGMKLFLADQSVEEPNFDLAPDKFHFEKKFVGHTAKEGYMTMDQWVNKSNISPDGDLLLQMDIEGGEYYSMISMSDQLLSRFRIMVFEFHSLAKLWNPVFFDLAKEVFDKILKTHTCVHIHPNNCCGNDNRLGITIPKVAEFTFLRNDRISDKHKTVQFPHPLDQDNEDGPSLILPTNWYGS